MKHIWDVFQKHFKQYIYQATPNHLSHIFCLYPMSPVEPFLPPTTTLHPDCPPWDGNYSCADTLSLRRPFLSRSICLSARDCVLLSCPVTLYTSVFHPLSPSLNPSALMGVSFSFCSQTSCPTAPWNIPCTLPLAFLFLCDFSKLLLNPIRLMSRVVVDSGHIQRSAQCI